MEFVDNFRKIYKIYIKYKCVLQLSIYLVNFKRATIRVRLNGALVEDAHRDLRIGRLGAELVVGVTETLANSVDTDQGTCTQEVLALQASRSHGVLFGPHAVLVLRQELAGSELVARVASSRLASTSKVGRPFHRTQIGKARHLRLRESTGLDIRTNSMFIANFIGKVGGARISHLTGGRIAIAYRIRCATGSIGKARDTNAILEDLSRRAFSVSHASRIRKTLLHLEQAEECRVNKIDKGNKNQDN
jgi:hypothetical protein